MATSQHGYPGKSGGRSPLPAGMSRRRFLAGTAGAGALAISAGGIVAPAALAAAGGGQPGGLPSLQEVWGWEQQLVQFGTRYTGSPGHTAYVDWLTSGWPDHPIATVRPGAIPLYLGEGAPLYAAGLGTVSHCPLPTYLLQPAMRSSRACWTSTNSTGT